MRVRPAATVVARIHPVTISPDAIHCDVPGESIFLYAPDGGVPDSHAHPFRVARFSNNTKGLLERGPIAVFENGAFLGQGMVDPLPPGATATVPFALERSLAVAQTRTENEEGARVARIEQAAANAGRWHARERPTEGRYCCPSSRRPTPCPR